MVPDGVVVQTVVVVTGAFTGVDADEEAPADLSGLTLDSFDDLYGDSADWPGRPAEPMLPFVMLPRPALR